jgi:hypothetical protein
MTRSWAFGPQRRRVRGWVAGIVAGVLVASGIAVAAWLVNGSGEAYSRAGSLVAPTTLDASASVVAELFPGETGDLAMRFHNSNGTDVEVSNIAGTGPSNPANCLVTVDAIAVSGQSVVVPAGGEATLVVPDGASMDQGADTTCQGQTITVPISFQASTT